MKPRVHVITLGVEDLERALEFYTRLGLPTSGITGTEYVGDETTPAGAVAMFELEGGPILAVYPRTELAKDAGIAGELPPGGAVSIGHFVKTEDEVDAVLAAAEAAGATPMGAPHARPWGMYSGYFRDPDGHLWEIVCNPDLDET